MSKRTANLYCFSPAAMLGTFVIELALAVYLMVRYKMSPIVRLSVAMLVSLAIFQLAEFNVCGTASTIALAWSRIGYVAITLLPPLALHLVHVVSKEKSRWMVRLAYGSGLGFAVTFGLNASTFAGHVCAGNYAIFQLVRPLGGLYFAYYYAWLFVGIGTCLYFGAKAELRVRKALILQVCGYLSFLLPTGVVNALNPQTISGIPSVMCGFAVIYAIILALGIVPIADELHT